MPSTDQLDAPATHRNREPLLKVLRKHLPTSGTVLEIAAGTGQHAVFFAEQLPAITWQPSDPDELQRRSIDAWREATGLANVRPALDLDVGNETWPIEHADAIVCTNMIHITPWDACLDLMRGAARILPPDGVLIMYGPYNIGRLYTSVSNQLFNSNLRNRNSTWGIRDISDVNDAAVKRGFRSKAFIAMPANNHTAIFRRLDG